MSDCPLCSRPLPSPDAKGCPSCGWAAPAPEPALSPDQRAAWDLLESEEQNVLVSGPAGTGKSFLVEKWRREGAFKARNVAVTASTGIAATHVGGRTLHSWAGMGLGTESAERIAEDPKWGWRYRIGPRIRATDVLLISEISMVNGRTLALVSDLCRIARGPKGAITSKQRALGEQREKLPFGGIKLVLEGDMGQLPPVEEETGFPFETSEWWDASIRTAELTTAHRQADPAFVALLHQVRHGTLDAAGTALLESRVRAFDPDAEPQAVRVATHNAQVDAVNSMRLAALPGRAARFEAVQEGDQKAQEQLEKHCLSPRFLDLKQGARVIFTRNDPESLGSRWVNGTLGTVTWLDEAAGSVEVTTDDGLVACPDPVLWQQGVDPGSSDIYRVEKGLLGLGRGLFRARDPGKGEAFRLQLPLRLAWSMTVHKCVHPSTLVETDMGMVRLGDAPHVGKIGTVAGQLPYDGFVRNPVGPGLRVVTRRGYEVWVTPDHGLMEETSRGEFSLARADSLAPGSVLRLSRGYQVDSCGDLSLHENTPGDVREFVYRAPKEMSLSLAEFLGFMVGDGTLFERGFRLAKRHRDVVARFASLASDLFGALAHVEHKERWSVAEVCSTWISRWLSSIDGISPNTKAVPSLVLRAPLSFQCAFLRSLFEDGSVQFKKWKDTKRFDHVEWSTSQAEMSRVVQVMLLRLGIVSTRYPRDTTQRSGKRTRSWRIAIYGTDAILFREVIGFVSAFKNERLDKATALRGISDLTDAFSDPVATIEPVYMESVCVTVPGHGRFVQDGFDGSNCQGMTIPRVSLDLGHCFAPGQAYVALSRARTLQGMNIENWAGSASIFAHPTAVAFIRGEYRPPEGAYVPSRPEAAAEPLSSPGTGTGVDAPAPLAPPAVDW